MPQYRNPFEKGDLYMKFDVQFPENNWINPDKLSELEDLLPSRPEVPNIIGDTEEVELQEFDSTQGSGGGQRCDAYNDIALMKKAVAIMDQECNVPISKLCKLHRWIFFPHWSGLFSAVQLEHLVNPDELMDICWSMCNFLNWYNIYRVYNLN